MPPPVEIRRVGVISLGCPKNLVDTEVMLGELRRQGYELVADLEQADTVIVNTCGFIEEAKQESIDTILEVASHRPKRLLVAGCMVNRYGTELAAAMPEIDGFIGIDELREAPKLIQLGGRVPATGPSRGLYDERTPRLVTTRGYAYLKVAEGCDNPCTFCAIPQWRGRFRSRTIDSLVAEAGTLEQSGVRELCLVAQDTTRYGQDLGLGRHGLTRLVERLLAGTEIPWIRFLYAYPTTLDEELLRLMGSERRFAPYLDMPLQHSHPQVLRAMRRGGSADRYLQLLERARRWVPDISLRSTFIVGFPGEGDEQFQSLLDFVQRAEFDHLGAFVFSPEPDTPAVDVPGPVPAAVARRRRSRLLEIQEPIARERRRRWLGQRLEVLVEGVCSETEHLLQGRHRGMAPEIDGRILINEGVASAGELAEVEITEAFADDLVGRIVGSRAVSALSSAGGDRR